MTTALSSIQRKIRPIAALGEELRTLKARGQKVVQCHGCFDLLHVGHIKHLNGAKELGDILVVSITADRFIHKGPGRPVFNQLLRMEQIASLECVDYVTLSENEDGIPAIHHIQPSIYVKGSEYQEPEKDVTGKMALEKAAVEAGGGVVQFTDLPTFSSTQLINEHFSPLPEPVSRYLQDVKRQWGAPTILRHLDEMKDLRVLVLGDTIIDEYCYCHVSGTVSKYPTLAAIYDQTVTMLGGVLAVARHIKGFTKSVSVVSWLGDQNDLGPTIRETLMKDEIEADFVTWPGQSTPLKRRFITADYPNPLAQGTERSAKGTRLFELGYLPRQPMDAALADQVCQKLESLQGQYDLVIGTDFGHGLFHEKVIRFLEKSKSWLAINAQTNSSNFGFNHVTKYKDADFVCIDELEARLPFGDRTENLDVLAQQLRQGSKADSLMITRGKLGLALYNDSITTVPPLASNIVDTVGSGDAVLSLSALSRYLNHPAGVSAFVGACAGAIACQIPGNLYPVQKPRMVKFVEGLLK